MEAIKTGLKGYDKSKIDIYIAYLKRLKGEKKGKKFANTWFGKVPNEIYISVFKIVYATGLNIDGETVSLDFDEKLEIIYDYHAYQNKLLIAHPESVLDFQVVYKGDTFSFAKDSGKVTYMHEIDNPFAKKKEIIGAYGVIKNNRGEFIEFLNREEIDKLKNVSNIKETWDIWESRFVLKSIIKRMCKAYFNDITHEIDIIDNESNEPENALIENPIQKKIKAAKTEKAVNKIYKENIEEIEDKKAFIQMCTDRKTEIKKA